jgi:hypothetical protein
MHKPNIKNERIKRRFFRWLKDEKREKLAELKKQLDTIQAEIKKLEG